jgi:hypothetical protein
MRIQNMSIEHSHASDSDNPLKGTIENSHYSLGFICTTLQWLPNHVATMAKHCGIAPSLVLDGTPYFKAEQIQQMADEAARIRSEVVATN